jgi:hypothetical protein
VPSQNGALPVALHWHRAEFTKLEAANLSDTRILRPQAHIGVSQKQDWFQVAEGIPQLDKQP